MDSNYQEDAFEGVAKLLDNENNVNNENNENKQNQINKIKRSKNSLSTDVDLSKLNEGIVNSLIMNVRLQNFDNLPLFYFEKLFGKQLNKLGLIPFEQVIGQNKIQQIIIDGSSEKKIGHGVKINNRDFFFFVYESNNLPELINSESGSKKSYNYVGHMSDFYRQFIIAAILKILKIRINGTMCCNAFCDIQYATYSKDFSKIFMFFDRNDMSLKKYFIENIYPNKVFSNPNSTRLIIENFKDFNRGCLSSSPLILLQLKKYRSIKNLFMNIASILMQTFYSLHAAYNMIGFVHGDLHTENARITNSDEELTFEFDSGDLFTVDGPILKIIDFGRSIIKYPACIPKKYVTSLSTHKSFEKRTSRYERFMTSYSIDPLEGFFKFLGIVNIEIQNAFKNIPLFITLNEINKKYDDSHIREQLYSKNLNEIDPNLGKLFGSLLQEKKSNGPHTVDFKIPDIVPDSLPKMFFFNPSTNFLYQEIKRDFIKSNDSDKFKLIVDNIKGVNSIRDLVVIEYNENENDKNSDEDGDVKMKI
jgi:hypothetical protein